MKLGFIFLVGLYSIAFSYFRKEEYSFEPVSYKIASIKLKDGFILKDSLFIFVNDSLLPKDAYSFDCLKGEIFFSCSIPEGALIRVVYYHLPFKKLRSEYCRYQVPESLPSQKEESLREPFVAAERSHPLPLGRERSVPSGGSEASERTPAGRDSSFFISEEELSLDGSKSIGFSYGSEGFSIEQSTDLRVKGKFEGVGIELLLAERGLPREGEAATFELEELDAISLVLTREDNKLTFGDFENLTPFSEFGSIRRKGQGFRFQRENQREKIFVGYQRPKNKSQSLHFSGEDGKKGPYLLTAEGRRVSVIPGSEEVYLDGQRLKRGEDADYTLNYSQGELTFTNRVLINSLSRIEVKFLYSALDYERNFYSLFLKREFSPLRFSFSGFREDDGKDYNFTYPLTEEEMRYLATIGDDTTKAFLPSLRYVGPNRGSYRKEGRIFVYVGKDSGDYEGSFSFVGDGRGDYIYDNRINGYYYVGENQGRWTPRVRVALPQKRQIYSPSLSYSQSPITLSFQGLFLSNDLNTFSTLDDNDNTSLGYSANVEYKLEKILLVAKRKGYQKNYRFLEGEERDFAYRWGETKDSIRSINLLEGSATPFNFLKLDFGGGLLEKERRSSSLFYSGLSLSFVSLRVAKAGRDWREEFNISPTFKYLKPGFKFKRENRPNSTTLRYYPNITLYPLGQEINTGWEEIRLYERGGLKDRQRRLKGEVKLTYNPLSFSLLLGREEKKDLQAAREIKQNFGNAEISLTTDKGISLLAEGSLLHKGAEEKEVNYVKVEEGKGNYKKDPHTGQYFYHPRGDYVRVFVRTGKIIPAQERNLKGNLLLSPAKPLSLSLNLNLREEKTGSASFFKNAGTSGYLTYGILPDLTLKFNKNYSSYLDRNFYYENDRQEDVKTSLGAEKKLGQDLMVEPRLEFASQKRFKNENLTQRLRTRGLVSETFVGFFFTLNFRVGYSLIYGEDKMAPSFRINKSEIGISRRFDLKGRTSIDFNFNLTRRQSKDLLPYDLMFTEPLGNSYEIGITTSHAQRENVAISLSYSLKGLPREPIDHILSSNMRIDF